MIKTIFPVLSILVAIALYFMFTDPKLDEIKVLQEENVRLDNAIAQTLQLSQVFERLESQFNALPKENLAMLEKMLIEEVDPVRLIYDIDNIAAVHGKKIENVTVSDLRGKKDTKNTEQFKLEPNNIAISFTVEATYDELLDFISDLEQSLQIVDIENINFAVQENFSGQSKLIHRIILRTYTL